MSFYIVDAHPSGRAQQRCSNRTAAGICKMDVQILQANANNFNWKEEHQQPHRSREQPMMLTAWTQTTGDDFELLRSLDQDPQLMAENRALRDKVRYLESKLQEHTDLLSQIHETSARMQQTAAAVQTPPQILTPPSSVICAPQQQQQPQQQQHQPHQQQHQTQHAEVIDYKIIAAPDDDADAIEIRLAAESLNSLSTSADSDCLEICLNQQNENVDTKQECSTPMQPNKRLKLDQIQQRVITPTIMPKPAMTGTSPITTPLGNNNRNNSYKLPTRRSKKSDESKLTATGDQVMVSIGPNNTCVPASIFENINWSVSSLATRKLLVAIFDRETLATHSMTGKPSPAFKDQHKPLKQMLDPLKIQDIIFAVTHKSNASEKEVRNAITTKCADENKMMKIQMGKRSSFNGDKENLL